MTEAEVVRRLGEPDSIRPYAPGRVTGTGYCYSPFYTTNEHGISTTRYRLTINLSYDWDCSSPTNKVKGWERELLPEP